MRKRAAKSNRCWLRSMMRKVLWKHPPSPKLRMLSTKIKIWKREKVSVITKSSNRSARAEWAKFILPKIQNSTEKLPLKFSTKNSAAHESNLERFIREAKAASALNHPNILVIHEIGESENSNYIVSEFIEGETLREYCAKSTVEICRKFWTSPFKSPTLLPPRTPRTSFTATSNRKILSFARTVL